MQIGKAKKRREKYTKIKINVKRKTTWMEMLLAKCEKSESSYKMQKIVLKMRKKYCDEITWHLLMSPYSNYTNQGPSLLMNGQTIMKYRQEKGQKIQEWNGNSELVAG